MQIPTYPLTALPHRATARQLAEADGPRVINRSMSDPEIFHAAWLIVEERHWFGYSVAADWKDVAVELLIMRGDFSSEAVPVSTQDGYDVVLAGDTHEVAHRCSGDYGVALDRAVNTPDFWVVYYIDPDGEHRARLFADEAPARLEFGARVRRLEAIHGELGCCLSANPNGGPRILDEPEMWNPDEE